MMYYTHTQLEIKPSGRKHSFEYGGDGSAF